MQPVCAPPPLECVKYDPAISTWHPNLFQVSFTVQGFPVGTRGNYDGPSVQLNGSVTIGTGVFPQGNCYSFRLTGKGENLMLVSWFVKNDGATEPVRIAGSFPVLNSIDSAVCADGVRVFPAETFVVLVRVFTDGEWIRVKHDWSSVERPMQRLMFDHVRLRPLTELETRNLLLLREKEHGHKGDICFMLRGGGLCLCSVASIQCNRFFFRSPHPYGAHLCGDVSVF